MRQVLDRWLPGAVAGIAGLLLISSLLTARALRDLRVVYLRDRAAALAAHLENLPAAPDAELADTLSAEEPALAAIHVFDTGQNVELRPLFEGKELFRMREIDGGLQRFHVPFHSGSVLRVAQIDLSVQAASFLTAEAWRTLAVAAASGVALIMLSVYLVAAARRNARIDRHPAEFQQLARLGTLSAVLAHEIRNPLGAIKGYVQLAAEQGGRQDLLDPALHQVARLEKLAHDLLSYGRPRTPSLAPIAWNQIAAGLEDLAARLRHARFHVGKSSLTLYTDSQLLAEILTNLVHNAIDAAGAVGTVRVNVVRSTDLSIVVQDDGPGLPDSVRQRLFEPFVTTKASGTGLGLAIAAKLAAVLGGTLSIEPTSPRGTRATLTLPHGALI